MNEQQCNIIAAMRPKLVGVIKCNIGSYLTWLEINDGIENDQRQRIDVIPVDADKASETSDDTERKPNWIQ